MRIRVKHSHAIGGYRQDNAKLNILAGIYQVEPIVGPEPMLRIIGADQANGGDLILKLGEYLFLSDFPDVGNEAPVAVLND